MDDLKRLVSVTPAHTQGHVLLARMLHQSGQLHAALAHYDQAIALNQNDETLQKIRGRLAGKAAAEKTPQLTMRNDIH